MITPGAAPAPGPDCGKSDLIKDSPTSGVCFISDRRILRCQVNGIFNEETVRILIFRGRFYDILKELFSEIPSTKCCITCQKIALILILMFHRDQ